MKTVILAAGQSKRMKPIEDKNFLKFLGKPLIQHQIESLVAAGFNDFIVVGGKHNLPHLRELKRKMRLQIHLVEQKNLSLGMVGAVIDASEHFGNEPVLIVSGNDVVDKSAFELIKNSYQDKGVNGLMIVKHCPKYFPGGYLKLDKRGFIKEIIEKPAQGKEPSKVINLVVHLYKNPKTFVKYLAKAISNRDDLYETAVNNMISDGYKMKAVMYDGFWQAVKYPWHAIDLWKHFFDTAVGRLPKESRISKKAQISPSAIIKGDVIIEDGVKIYEHAVINRPVYIGKNSVIANGCLVRESHIGENCVIGKGTEIARSYLADNVWTHSNYIGDSVIGDNNSFGAGAVTGNLRLDEKNIFVKVNGEKIDSGKNKFGIITGKNVRVGINTSIMPGVKIGNNSFVGAGIVLAENVDDNKFVTGKWELRVSDNLAVLDKKARE
ncbi:NTP transferase domain-containing protein, partial [Candidatus Peregrinibacteria bacterium]|nr:NTP transferase domain-containing protein [Candidatus Peregrinibacteria bacterium]